MVIKFKRRWVNWIDLFLKTVGVNILKNDTEWYELHHFGTIFVILVASVHIFLYSFVNRKIIKEAIIGVGFLAGVLVVLASVYVFWKKKEKILKILRSVDDNVYKYSFEDSIRFYLRDTLKEDNFFKVVLIVLAYESLGFSIGISSPLITFLVFGAFQACIIPAWYPQHPETIFGLVYNLFIQMISSLAVFWLYNVSQMVIVSLTIEFIRQFERLKAALRSVQSVTESMVLKQLTIDSSKKLIGLEYERQFRETYDSIYRENFAHCLKHHQKLHKLFQDFEPLFSLLYSIELAVSMASFAVVFYNVLFVRDPWDFLSVVGCACVLLTNFFSKCFVGEMFAKLNEEVRDVTFYDMNWWEVSIENRKMLFIFHDNTRTSTLDLKGILIYNAS